MGKPNIADYYSARAPEYEQIYYRDVPDRRREIDEAVLDLRRLALGKDILELACGTGYWTFAMSATARHITAVDISEEMLVEARKKDYHCPVEFKQADMFAHPVESTHELVVSGFWFSHQPRQDYDALFDLLERTTLPDGKIWLIDNNPPAEGTERHSVKFDEHGNHYKKRWLEDGSEYVILKNYFSEQELRDIFTPRFRLDSLTYGEFYWVAQLSLRPARDK
jgi:ubiquinone/menaquinone biosynthesis C-methylase UbiE